MKVNMNCKSIVEVDIDSEEAFRILVKTLHMEFMFQEFHRYYTRSHEDKGLCVFDIVDGHDELVDERGELYEALLATANYIFPNV